MRKQLPTPRAIPCPVPPCPLPGGKLLVLLSPFLSLSSKCDAKLVCAFNLWARREEQKTAGQKTEVKMNMEKKTSPMHLSAKGEEGVPWRLPYALPASDGSRATQLNQKKKKSDPSTWPNLWWVLLQVRIQPAEGVAGIGRVGSSALEKHSYSNSYLVILVKLLWWYV